jgi:hypothetical protein
VILEPWHLLFAVPLLACAAACALAPFYVLALMALEVLLDVRTGPNPKGAQEPAVPPARAAGGGAG